MSLFISVVHLQEQVSAEVATLLKLKSSYKDMTGEEFAPAGKGKQDKKKEKKTDKAVTKPEAAVVTAPSKEANELKSAITKQGDKVRELKTSGAPKVRYIANKSLRFCLKLLVHQLDYVFFQDQVEVEVKTLLSLKAQYKELTGEDATPSGKSKKEKKKESKPQENKPKENKKSVAATDEGDGKKTTR